MTAGVFRGERGFPGLINAFAPSFTKERIVKVRHFIDFVWAMCMSHGQQIVTHPVNWMVYILNSTLQAAWQTNDCLPNKRLSEGRRI